MLSGSRPRYEPWERQPYQDFPNRVLILGGGFAGYTAAKTLCRLTRHRDDVGVMLISRENYFTFWPMLAGAISSDIETKNVAQPLRRALIRDGASFRRAEVESIDLEKRCVTADGREFPYDHLIVALGGEPAYFGIPGVEKYAISMTGIGGRGEDPQPGHRALRGDHAGSGRCPRLEADVRHHRRRGHRGRDGLGAARASSTTSWPPTTRT